MEQDAQQVEGEYDDLLAKSLEGGSDLDKKPLRHYWSHREEECFFEIWGRDNWRLTRHGKNTIFFGNWADELKQRFNIDVKPEEIQAKVNQTRAKFRQVKKQLEMDKTSVRWKKFNIIGRILRNQYRPKDAEPVPPEALERNRDYSPTELSMTQQLSPTSVTSNSNAAEDMEQHNNGQTFTDQNASNAGSALYNNGNNTNTNYTVELFADTDIKDEYEFEIKDDSQKTGEQYQGYQYQPQQQPHAYVLNEIASELKPELHELQTPLQQQQQQQYHGQQSNYDVAGGGNTASGSNTAIPLPNIHTSESRSPSQSSSVVNNVYEHAPNAYGSPVAERINEIVNATVNIAPTSTMLTNNQNHFGNSSSHQSQQINTADMAVAAAPVATADYNNHGYNNANTNNINNNVNVNTSNGNSNSIMQPPRPAPQPRRRRAPSVSATYGNNFTSNALATQSTDNFESLYMEEVRKKNYILAEHNEIERKRLQLEERKVALLEQFLPNCLDMQEQILRKLGNDS